MVEKERLEELSLLESEPSFDVEFILNGIKHLRSERFRKSSLAKKREILKTLVKSIHIHPENMIRMDFWGSEESSDYLRGRLKSARYKAFKLKPNGGVLQVRRNEV